ncbi:hypothetical protein ACHAW6_002921 [Cyclotella cf. meneghiniana]
MATSPNQHSNYQDEISASKPSSGLPSISHLSLTQDVSTNPPSRTNKRYRPKSSSLPTSLVRTFQLRPNNNDSNNCQIISTEIIVQLFSDRIFLSLTQLHGKIGSLLLCTVEESVIDNSTTYDIRTLLGTGVGRSGGNSSVDIDKEMAFREVLVRRIAEGVVRHARRKAGVSETTILGAEGGACVVPPLVVGVGLRPGVLRGVDQLKGMVDATMEVYEEGWRRRLGAGLVGMEGPD